MKKIIKIHKNDEFKKINATLSFQNQVKKHINVEKLQGGVLMDMGPYISALPRLFNLKKLVRKIEIKNKENLIMSIKFSFNFKEGNIMEFLNLR